MIQVDMILELSPCYPRIWKYNTKKETTQIILEGCGYKKFDITNCTLVRFQVVFTIDMVGYNHKSQKFQDFGELDFQKRLTLI